MKIATIERITSVRHHPNADRLDLVSILGYQCITSRDSFLPEQLVIFIQPDSVLPNDQSWAQPYLKYARPRVRAIKIRDEWSEGLIVPLTDNEKNLKEGDNVAEQLGIKHFEPIIIQDPTSILGPLPFNIPKTDEDRIENFQNNLPWNELVDVTKKIDGTSCSIYYSYEKKQFECLINFCEQYQISLVLRGELYGGGIQKKVNNSYCTQSLQWAMFSVYLFNINNKQGRYTRRKTDDLLYFIKLAEHLNLPYVPLIENQVPLTQQLIDKYSCQVDITFGEGVVIQHDHGSFKIINKNYDAKN
ncbi:unnamed protein product [Rotaria sordida]|uniref:RNA ligase domain-containing protein n=1 Tax=Rotaria sordida TaxID=392033 RepID=A0A814E0W4_9BILA|nr:unnamed protein product [Rotaria sordida]